jgi:hypothetical protein
MTVGTNQVAFGHFLPHSLAASVTDKIRDVISLLCSIYVIKIHDEIREEVTAILARMLFFVLPQGFEGPLSCSFSRFRVLLLVTLKVRSCEFGNTCFALPYPTLIFLGGPRKQLFLLFFAALNASFQHENIVTPRGSLPSDNVELWLNPADRTRICILFPDDRIGFN